MRPYLHHAIKGNAERLAKRPRTIRERVFEGQWLAGQVCRDEKPVTRGTSCTSFHCRRDKNRSYAAPVLSRRLELAPGGGHLFP
jgi:hypothetical protein